MKILLKKKKNDQFQFIGGMKVGEPSAPYGRYGNIFLSQTEYDELQAEYPDRLERFIEEMSRYLAANGKSYQNYAAALRIWAGNDKKEAPKKGIPDYSCKEGESL